MLLSRKEHMYKLLVDKLYDKCQKIQVENERFVMRLNGLKKIIRRRTNDVELLKRHLDKHGDNWRSIPMTAPHPNGKVGLKRGPKPKNKQPGETNAARKPRKQRVRKQNTDVNMVGSAEALTPQLKT